MHRYVLAILMAFATPALAADPAQSPPAAEDPRDLIFDLGAGVGVAPKFPGSSKYTISAFGIFDPQFIRLPFFGVLADGSPSFLSVFPSFNIVGERSVDDAGYLAGIADRDVAVEVGAGVAIEYRMVRAFAEVRYGVTGHEGFVGEVGADLTLNPTDRLEVSFGPRLGFASEAYYETYFDVPVTATQLAAHDAGPGGFKDVGLEAEAILALTEKVRLHGRASWRRLIGEAGDSPIVEAGSKNAFTLGLGLSYRFGFDVFD
ncbi:MAG: MipA/OmpV family protein [Pseudomonadota bacterium]